MPQSRLFPTPTHKNTTPNCVFLGVFRHYRPHHDMYWQLDSDQPLVLCGNNKRTTKEASTLKAKLLAEDNPAVIAHKQSKTTNQ